MTAMSVAAASVPIELQLRVPAEYARTKARKMVLGLLLYVLVVEMLFVAYDLHIGHERLTSDGVIVLISGFWNQPWLSLSSSHWIYAVNDKGIYLRGTPDVINSTGFNLIRWDRCNLLSFHLGKWRDWPALNVKFTYKGREHTKLFVFRPEDENTVSERLIPWLTAKSLTYTSGTTPAD